MSEQENPLADFPTEQLAEEVVKRLAGQPFAERLSAARQIAEGLGVGRTVIAEGPERVAARIVDVNLFPQA